MVSYNDEFKNIDTEAKAYFLGFFHADGSLHYSKTAYSSCSKLKLGIKDEEIIKRFESEFPFFNISYSEDSYVWNNEERFNNKVVLRSYNKELYADLVNIGVKSILLDLPEELFIHYIRGYIDGDGCYSKQITDGKPYWNMTLCITEPEITPLQDFFNSYGIHSTVRQQGKIYVLRVRRKADVELLIGLLYTDSSWYLKRKKALADEILSPIKIA